MSEEEVLEWIAILEGFDTEKAQLLENAYFKGYDITDELYVALWVYDRESAHAWVDWCVKVGFGNYFSRKVV